VATAEFYFDVNAPVSDGMHDNLWIHSIRPASEQHTEMAEALALGAWGNNHLFTGGDWDDLAHKLKIVMASLLGYGCNHPTNPDFMQKVHLQWMHDFQQAAKPSDNILLDLAIPRPGPGHRNTRARGMA
jgi:hypothetical protein